jgi:murein DD-endopeptidase MepM/ murein hydrolase activator NlpD
VRDFFRNTGGQALRLALILCLFQWLPPAAAFIPARGGRAVLRAALGGSGLREAPAVQSGVGGGSLPGTLVSGGADAPAGIAEALTLETGVLEPELFSKPRMLLYDTYTIQKGDIIGDLAAAFGLNQDTLISVNNIKNSRLIQIGQELRVPNQDGVFYTVQTGDTLQAIAEKYKAEPGAIRIVNELFSEALRSGAVLFIPGGRLDWINLQEINGDLFIWPIPGYITSSYGYRTSPFTGIRQFHSGLDIGSPAGTAVKAAMPGRVSAVGWDDVLGNYVVVSHHSGYRTLYGHLSVARAKPGAYVGTGERIGDVGSTGLSTGPHLHFTVYKNGKTVNPRVLMK